MVDQSNTSAACVRIDAPQPEKIASALPLYSTREAMRDAGLPDVLVKREYKAEASTLETFTAERIVHVSELLAGDVFRFKEGDGFGPVLIATEVTPNDDGSTMVDAISIKPTVSDTSTRCIDVEGDRVMVEILARTTPCALATCDETRREHLAKQGTHARYSNDGRKRVAHDLRAFVASARWTDSTTHGIELSTDDAIKLLTLAEKAR